MSAVQLAGKYLVTGGAGFIGSAVVRALLAGGSEVVVVDDLSTGRRENLDPRARFVQSDFADPAMLGRELSGKDGVFHLAAFIDLVASFDRVEECVRTNVEKSVRLLEAVKRARVPRLVFSSTAAIYDGIGSSRRELPSSPYGASKLFFEHILRGFANTGEISAVALRYFNVYGPGQRPGSAYAAVIPKFISLAIAGKPLTIQGDGKQRRDFIEVSDVALANVAAMKRADGFTSVDVGWGKSASILNLVSALSAAMGRELPFVHVARPKVDADDSVAVSDELMRRFSWRPEVDFVAGLTGTVNWFQKMSQREAGLAEK